MARELYQFDSISQYGDYVAASTPNPEAATSSGRGLTEDKHDIEWFGNISFDGALAMAREGGNWAEGARHMRPVDLSTMDIDLSGMPAPVIEHHVTGFMPDVPAYLAGNPECMLTINYDEQPNKVIRIGAQIDCAAQVKADALFNRGTAILSVIDELTKRGYSVELTAIDSFYSNGTEVCIETIIKRPNDIWSPESVAYALCHVAFSRRLGFAMVEQSSHPQITHSAYGNGRHADLSGFDLTFGHMINNRPFKDIETAIRTIVGEVNAQVKAQAAA